MLDLSRSADPVADFRVALAANERFVVSTSGTSVGAARRIVRTAASWADSFSLVARRIGLDSGDTMWIPGPLSATMNLFAACLCDAVGARWSTSPQGASIWQVTPTRLAANLGVAASGIRALVAGDGLTPLMRDQARAAGVEVHHYYGAAELSFVAWGTCSADLRPFDRVDIETRNGVLWVRSPWLSEGPEHASSAAGWRTDNGANGYATVGDVGSLVRDAEGIRVQVHGRTGAITTAGHTIELAPIAAVLGKAAHGDLWLLGLSHPVVGQLLTCVLSRHDDLQPVKMWARTQLHDAQRPRRYVVVERPPVSESGKVDLSALATLLGGSLPTPPDLGEGAL